MVYSSSPDGHVVDKKAYNFHMSARPALTANIQAAGSTCWTLTTTGDIPAGCIVIEDSTTAGRINVSAGAAEELLLGIATVTREGNDARPLTYTICGVVEMIAGVAVTKGDILQACDTGDCEGSAEPWINDVDDTNAEGLTAYKRKFGKALTTAAAAGDRFWAYVNFMN